MCPRASVKPDTHTIMLQWRGTSTPWRMNAPTCTNSGQMRNCTRRWRNSPMRPTTMCAHTAITATAHHTRHGQQHKERGNHTSWWDCLITQDRREVLSITSPQSGAKHYWQGLTASVDSKQQSNKFLATSVTKKLDHYNHIPCLISIPSVSSFSIPLHEILFYRVEQF